MGDVLNQVALRIVVTAVFACRLRLRDVCIGDSGMCVARELYEMWGRSPYTRMFVARTSLLVVE